MEELFKLLFKPDTFAMALCVYLLVRFEQNNGKFASEIRESNKALAEDLRTSFKDLVESVTENNRLLSMMIYKNCETATDPTNGKINLNDVVTLPEKKITEDRS